MTVAGDEPSHPAESRPHCPLRPLFEEPEGLHAQGRLPAAILNRVSQQYQYLNRSLHPLIFCYFFGKVRQSIHNFLDCFIEEIHRFTQTDVGLCQRSPHLTTLVVLHPSAHPPGQGRGIEG